MSEWFNVDEKCIKEFTGYSGSRIFLVQRGDQYLVRKIGNVVRNYERLTALKSKNYPVVNILEYTGKVLDLEYVPSLDISTYLQTNSPNDLLDFLKDIIGSFKKDISEKNYHETYDSHLDWIDDHNLPFSRNELLDRLPKILPMSEYFGDLTLENILFNTEKGFILIDGATTGYDSYRFDLAKLNQDLMCNWFLRNRSENLDHKLGIIKTGLDENFGETDNCLVILMLLRIYKHALNDTRTMEFLKNNMEQLWT